MFGEQSKEAKLGAVVVMRPVPWNHGQISPYRASCADAGSCDDADSRFTCGDASDLRRRFVAGEGSAGCLGFLGGMLFEGAGETVDELLESKGGHTALVCRVQEAEQLCRVGGAHHSRVFSYVPV